MNSLELIDLRNQITEKLEKLIEVGKVEQRKLNDDENSEFDNLTNQITEIDNQILEIEKENKRNFGKAENKKITEKRMENIKLINVISKVAEKRELTELEQNFLNMGKSEFRKNGLVSNGEIQIPFEMRADITATGSGAGVENVSEVKFSILEPLYANLTLAQAGANIMTGLVGDVSLPTYAGSSVAWKGEVVSATDGAGAFGEVILKPKRLTAYVNVSKQFLAQDSNDAEGMLKRDIMTAISEKLESTILGNASGNTTQPAGLFYGVTGTTAASYTGITALEVALEDKNVKDYSFIVNPKAKGILKSKEITAGKMIYSDNQIDGLKVYSTSNVYSKGVVVADFRDLVIGIWGVELTVDPFTLAGNGEVKLVINAYVDAAFRRDSYSVINLA